MAAIDIRSNSDVGIAGSLSRNPVDRTGDVVTAPGELENRERNNRIDALPGSRQETGVINWLGSSYSGVDIKVVAHLYGTIDRATEIERLAASAHSFRDASGSLQSLLATSQIFNLGPTGRAADIFPDLAGYLESSGVTDSEARSIITPFYYALITLPSSAIPAMRNQAEILTKAAEGFEERLKYLAEIQEDATSTVTLATLQTLSVQTHRDKQGVWALGHSYVKGYTRGPRTIAGSMIFTVFNEHALARLIRSMSSQAKKYGEFDAEFSTYIADQLPPIDLTILFANEYGSLSQQTIYGVEFINDGTTYSIEDLLTEEVVSFVARDVDVMTAKGKIRLSKLQRGMNQRDTPGDESATSLLLGSKTAYNAYLDKLKLRRQHRSR